MADVSNRDDIIDSRDVIARIEELETERDDLQSAMDDAQEEMDAMLPGDDSDPEALKRALEEATKARANWETTDEAEELKALQALQAEAEGYTDWNHGAQLIRDSYFEDHARELAEDQHGNKIRDAEWPFSCIDWERAATELQQDYTAVEFDGVTYWVR